jgi:hypothetical protein
MFKERPLQWIGEAEARQMLIHARSEASVASCSDENGENATAWFTRMRRWIYPDRSVEAGC